MDANRAGPRVGDVADFCACTRGADQPSLFKPWELSSLPLSDGICTACRPPGSCRIARTREFPDAEGGFFGGCGTQDTRRGIGDVRRPGLSSAIASSPVRSLIRLG
jgi:hypothetical protein